MAMDSVAQRSLPRYRENPKFRTYHCPESHRDVARYAQVGDVVYCGERRFGECIREATHGRIAFMMVQLRSGEYEQFELAGLRVLESNYSRPRMSMEQAEILQTNHCGLRTQAEIEQALLLDKPRTEQFLGQRELLEARDVLGAHEIMFGGVFPWGGQLRESDVVVGREHDATPSPAELEAEMIQFDRFLYEAQYRWRATKPLLSESAIWLGMASVYVELCRIHPFRDGNGRTSRVLIEALLANHAGVPIALDWDGIARAGAKTRWAFRQALHHGNLRVLATLLFKAYRNFVRAQSGLVPECPEGLVKWLCG